MRNIIILFFGITFSLACSSRSYVYEDRGYKFEAANAEECYGLGTSNPLLSVCQNHFKEASKNKLDNSYEKILSELSRDRGELIKAQEKWVEFSNLQCQFEAKASEASSKPYNAYTEIFNTCIEMLREERAVYLKKIPTGCPGCVQ